MHNLSKQQWKSRRPNKLAAGMNYTKDSCKQTVMARDIPKYILADMPNGPRAQFRGYRDQEHYDAVNALCVRGTTDRLGASNWIFMRFSICKCCGSKTGPKELTPKGKIKLHRMRKAKNEQRRVC